MRIQSSRPAKNGGFLHQIGEPRPEMPPPEPPAPPVTIDAAGMWAQWHSDTESALLEELAVNLNVGVRALINIGAAWAPPHNAWAFPMYDGAGTVVGIRLRSNDGKKRAVTGSKQGVFLSPTCAYDQEYTLVTEGPTDAACVMTLGFDAIGRPACRGGEVIIEQTCQRLGIKKIVIVADSDEPKKRPDGTQWLPGLEGAEYLANCLKIMSKIIRPPHVKDIRQWNPTRAMVEYLIRQKLWKKC
jgi:hypothetical protein